MIGAFTERCNNGWLLQRPARAREKCSRRAA